MIDLLVVIGDAGAMPEAVDAARAHARQVQLFAEQPPLSAGITAELILVCQQWPDEFPPGVVAELLRSAPLSRIVVSQGPWCASVGRTRRYWPPALCVPREEAAERVRRELDVIAGKRPPLPWTAGLDEIYAFDHSD